MSGCLRRCVRLLVLAAVVATAGPGAAADLPRFDLTTPEGVSAWGATHHILAVRPTGEGMLLFLSGRDPFITGPARDFPKDRPLWLVLRLKSDTGGIGQVFYFREEASEAQSVRFPVRAGAWEDVRMPLPPLGPGYRLRFDPPGGTGSCLLASIGFEERVESKGAPATRTE